MDEFITKKEFESYVDSVEKRLGKMNTQEQREPREPRELSEYNIFLKKTMAKLKKEDPSIANPVAFKKCAELWNVQKAKASKK